jgi:hypothetical protein
MAVQEIFDLTKSDGFNIALTPISYGLIHVISKVVEGLSLDLYLFDPKPFAGERFKS